MAIQNKRIILVCAGLAMCNVPVAGPAQAQDVSFEEPRAYETGDAPNSVAVSDFNRDGRPDLAVTYRDGVSVFLGNGDGTFQTAQNVPGCHPFSVAVGDFNGDGQQDLVVTDTFYDTVCVLLGNGDGSFQAARKIAVGRGPWSIAVGDFNGDGRPDLAVANMTSGTVSVLLGNGDGSFQGQRTLEAGRTPDSIAVGDFNGDGVPDLAVTTLNSPNVSVFLGNGDGSFRAPRNFLLGPEAIPMSVTVGDFNGDGRLDLAVTSIGFTNGITVLLGNGDGTFQAPRTFALGRSAGSIAVGDFNLDGLPDLAAVYLDPISYNGGVSVLLGNGDGSFLPPRNFPAGTVDPFGALAVADFNGDGRPDVALVNYPSNNVSVLINHSPE